MANKSQSDYEQRHEGEMSRRRILSYLVGAVALAAGVYYGLPALLERSPGAARSMEQFFNNIMRRNNDPDAVENIQERIDRLTRELEDRVESAVPIGTFEQLNAVRRNLSGNYKLVSDIHCPAGHNWEPIGTAEKPFLGIFNGQGHTVYDLRAEWPERDYVGMFGIVGKDEKYAGVVGNLKLERVNVRGRLNVGKLLGFNKGAFIYDVFSEGIVCGISCIGGNSGVNFEGIIKGCADKGNVDGGSCIGGLVGWNHIRGYVVDSFPNEYVQEDEANKKGSLIGWNNVLIIGSDDYSKHIINSSGTIGLDTSPKR